MASVEDPLDWTVDQVVEFLCRSTKTPWSQSANPPPRPDRATFEDALRTNMITGETLLYDVDKQTLREDLGLTRVGHWSTILAAIRYLRGMSRKYQRHQQTTPLIERSPSVFFEKPRTDSSHEIDRAVTRASELATSPSPERNIRDTAPSPHLRSREHYTVDQHGRKRRKLNLESTNLQSPTVVLTPRSDDTPSIPDRDWYIGPNKIDTSELFYPLTLSDDDDDDNAENTFLIYSPSFPTGQCLFVKQKLHHFYRQRPISLGRSDGSSRFAVMPYEHSNTEVRSPQYFTLYSLKNGKVTAQQEDVEKWPLLSGKETAQSESTSLKSDPFSYLIQKYPVEEGNEGACPLYGDSGSEGEYDEETWLEIDTEQRERHLAKPERLSIANIDSIIAKCVSDMEDNWRQYHQLKEERKARRLWLTSRKLNSTNRQIKSISRDVSLLEKRLQKIQGAIRESEYSSSSELQMQCQSMEQTVFNIQRQKWRVSILEQAECPPKIANSSRRPPAPKTTRDVDDGESLYSESDRGFDGSLDDFIIDDSDANERASELAPSSMEIDEVQAANVSATPNQDQDLPASDSDSVLAPSPVRRKLRRSRGKLQREEKRISPAVTPRKPSSPAQESASSGAAKDVPGLDCIDLTGDSPPPEREDLRIETPPLNPTEPNPFSSIGRTVKSVRQLSTSPAPDLASAVPNEGSNKSSAKIHRPRDVDTPKINFTEISSMDWNYLEERQERLKIMAKLTKSLPHEDRELLTQKIPDFLAGMLQKYVFKALKAISLQRDSVSGVYGADETLAMRTASLYVSWVNCKHYEGRGLPRKDVEKAIKNCHDFETFHNVLIRCLVAFETWAQDNGTVAQVEEISSNDEMNDLSRSARKKRKREVKESQEVKNTHETARLRAAVQDEERKRLERKLESMGLSNSDPAHQAVSFGSPIIYLDPHIGRRIKPHQLKGIQFMWRELIQDEKRHGCVLAHTMGLGKTMQV